MAEYDDHASLVAHLETAHSRVKRRTVYDLDGNPFAEAVSDEIVHAMDGHGGGLGRSTGKPRHNHIIPVLPTPEAGDIHAHLLWHPDVPQIADGNPEELLVNHLRFGHFHDAKLRSRGRRDHVHSPHLGTGLQRVNAFLLGKPLAR